MCFRLTDVAAAKEAGLMVDFNEKITIRSWRNDSTIVMETSQNQEVVNMCIHMYVLGDENCKKTALSWLHEGSSSWQ